MERYQLLEKFREYEKKSLISVVGGGDTVSAINKSKKNIILLTYQQRVELFGIFRGKRLAWPQCFKINNKYEFRRNCKKNVRKG